MHDDAKPAAKDTFTLIQKKKKSKPVFVSAYNLCRDQLGICADEIKNQKLNVIDDMNKSRIIIMVMREKNQIEII